MGGAKKKTLSQMEKERLRREREEAAKRRERERAAAERKERGILPPKASEGLVKEISKLDVLTPYSVASRFDLRLSAAKSLLRELESKGLIKLVQGNARLKIYRLASTPS